MCALLCKEAELLPQKCQDSAKALQPLGAKHHLWGPEGPAAQSR